MADNTNQTVEIKNVVLGKCLGVGAPGLSWATLADCSGLADQQWEQVRADGGKVILRNLADRTCLRGDLHVARWECDDEDEDQFWILGNDLLTHARTGQVADSYVYDHFGVILSDASGSAYQQWQVRVTGTAPSPPADTSGKVIQIKSVSDAKCAVASGKAARLGACAGAVERKFQRVELGEGVVQLRSVATGTCLRTGMSGIKQVDLATACAAGDAAQQWRIEPDLIGTFRIRNVASGDYLTPLGSSNNITTYQRESIANWQKWELNPA